MHFFTTASLNYLARARVLARSIKKYNSSAIFHLVLIAPPGSYERFSLHQEPFDHIWYAKDFLTKDEEILFYTYDALEVCGGMKPLGALKIFEKVPEIKTLIHPDSDISVYSSLNCIENELQENSILLTPHILRPNTLDSEIVFHELSFLKAGILNTGFFAVKRDQYGINFLSWWWHRLKFYGEIDLSRGLFADQKWTDFTLSLFPKAKLILDPGVNVATWNLSERKVSVATTGKLIVNNKSPLKFFHFSGLDSGAHRKILARYASPGTPLWDISLTYEKELLEYGHETLKKIGYPYDYYANGERISIIERRLYRDSTTLKTIFPNPFSTECQQWMHSHIFRFLRKPLSKISLRNITLSYLLLGFFEKITFGEFRKKILLNKNICRSILKKAAQGCSTHW